MAIRYERYERRPSVTGSNFRSMETAGSLDTQLLATTGLQAFWDFHPDRITAGTNQSIANRVNGGTALVEDTSYSNLVVDRDEAPPGGTMIRHGKFAADTVLTMTGFPSAANSVWTLAGCFKMDEPTALGAITQYMIQGPNGSTSNHWLYLSTTLLTHRIGTAGSYLDIYDRHAIGVWNFFFAMYNNTSKASRIVCNGTAPPASGIATGSTQSALQAALQVGGNASAMSLAFKGKLGPLLLWSGTSDATGNLFDASRAADLSLAAKFFRAQIGRLSL